MDKTGCNKSFLTSDPEIVEAVLSIVTQQWEKNLHSKSNVNDSIH